MDEASQALLRLADPRTRAALLDGDALLALAAVCYDLDPALVSGPTTAVYERMDIGVPVADVPTLAARVMRAGDAMPWDVTGTWEQSAPPVAGADAVMVGALVVRVAGGDGTIDRVQAAEPVLEAGGTGREALGLLLTMSAPPDQASAPPVALPVVIAFVAGDGSSSPRDLLRATAVARRAARPYPLVPAPDDAPRRRTDRCVCWLLPASVFDDPGWPGGTGADPGQQRAGRLASARAWLAAQGIAVVTT